MNPGAVNSGYRLITGKGAVIRDDAKPDSCKKLSLRLPYPPSANKYWRPVGKVSFKEIAGLPGRRWLVPHGKQVLTKAAKDYHKNVGAAVFEQGACRFTQRVSVSIQVVVPDRRKHDLDNLLKPTLDSLEHAGVLADDCLAKRILIEEVGIEKPGWLDILIETLPQPPLGAGGEQWHGTPARK